MKLEELAPHDFIYIDDEISQVDELIWYQNNGFNVEARPIELTDEILECNFDTTETDENGAKCFYTLNVGKIKNDSVSVIVGQDGYYLSIERSCDLGQVKKCVRYVHEIQDALRLCGLDGMAYNFIPLIDYRDLGKPDFSD